MTVEVTMSELLVTMSDNSLITTPAESTVSANTAIGLI